MTFRTGTKPPVDEYIWCRLVISQFTSKMASGAIKKATGLTGLAVVANPHKKLVILYDKILRTLQRIPEDAAYRKHTENIIKDRLALVKTAERELQLSRKMIEWKAWEPLIEQAPKSQWQWPMK
ncbi:hypothetical protein LSH36_23g01011 [Paralvinella palmiformis]|uniref:Uncharacterized protein n=1 Tax=Paralvinella palmiformis TaxID=53620 RepID=A0AAD9NGK5_9ANNE|nr:hypothetical protein LSH36_23g01011 [Paralvinella palmiformis]